MPIGFLGDRTYLVSIVVTKNENPTIHRVCSIDLPPPLLPPNHRQAEGALAAAAWINICGCLKMMGFRFRA